MHSMRRNRSISPQNARGEAGVTSEAPVPAGVQGEAEAAFEELRDLCVASHRERRELIACVESLREEVRRLETEVASLRGDDYSRHA